MSPQHRNDDYNFDGTTAKSPGTFEKPRAKRCVLQHDHDNNGNENTIIVPLIVEHLVTTQEVTDDKMDYEWVDKYSCCSSYYDSDYDSASTSSHLTHDDTISSHDDELLEDLCFPRFPTTTAPLAKTKEAMYAYKKIRIVRDAIFGTVWYGVEMKRSLVTSANSDGHSHTVEVWETTNREVAIKQMCIQEILDRPKIENPLQEISAMQHLYRQLSKLGNDGLQRDQYHEAMLDSNVMMLQDVLTDGKYLYAVMPYCGGGDFFDLLADGREKFSEEEARYLLSQILNGIDTLQRGGICHLDLSLENLVTTRDGKVMIIDFGACLKIPYSKEDSIKCGTRSTATSRRGDRCLIKPLSGPRGKAYYISNEVLRCDIPFDGHAADMFALGPILFMMVFGNQPWEMADLRRDPYFAEYSKGGFARCAANVKHGLSKNLIDLLQKMFYLDPKDRLSLEQVRSHPWMQGRKMKPMASSM